MGEHIDECYPGREGLQRFETNLDSLEVHVSQREIYNWRVGKHYPTDPKVHSALVKLLQKNLKEIEELCTVSRVIVNSRHAGRPVHLKRTLYRFQTTPRVVMSSWELADKTYGPHPADSEAYTLIARDMRLAGMQLDYPLISRDPSCPPTISGEDLILICGPNGNDLASQLNHYLSNSAEGAFYFRSIVPEPKPDLNAVRDQWVISHNIFKPMSVALTERAEGDVLIDYAIFYIGINPMSPQDYLIWIAGLGSHGTPGGARALVDSGVQAEIFRRFGNSQKHISAIVKCECSKDYKTGRTIDVLFSA